MTPATTPPSAGEQLPVLRTVTPLALAQRSPRRRRPGSGWLAAGSPLARSDWPPGAEGAGKTPGEARAGEPGRGRGAERGLRAPCDRWAREGAEGRGGGSGGASARARRNPRRGRRRELGKAAEGAGLASGATSAAGGRRRRRLGPSLPSPEPEESERRRASIWIAQPTPIRVAASAVPGAAAPPLLPAAALPDPDPAVSESVPRPGGERRGVSGVLSVSPSASHLRDEGGGLATPPWPFGGQSSWKGEGRGGASLDGGGAVRPPPPPPVWSVSSRTNAVLGDQGDGWGEGGGSLLEARV